MNFKKGEKSPSPQVFSPDLYPELHFKKNTMQTAIELIQEERIRQRDEHSFTTDHDDTHVGEELAIAASCYAYPPDSSGDGRLDNWPFNPDSFKPNNENRIRDLVKAGALIVAEIERLQRLDVPGTDTGQQ